MKKIYTYSILLIIIIILSSCGSGGSSDLTPIGKPDPPVPTVIAVSSIGLSYTKTYMENGGVLYLEAEVRPNNATDKTVTWSSSNTDVVSISSNGVATAKSKGTASITASCGTKSAACTITVLDEATDLSLFDIYGNGIAKTTANCYVVSKPGFYKIPMVYGNALKNGTTNKSAYMTSNSGDDILSNFLDHTGKGIGTSNDTKDPWVSQKYSINKAGLIWQDSKDLLLGIAMTGDKGVKEEKYVTFYIDKENFTQGNAIIAAYDSDNVVAWSWHIWVTDADLTTINVKNLSGVSFDFLPVFLGWCEPESEKSKNGSTYGNCTYYQWGRKDPMLPAKGNMYKTDKAYYGKNGYVDGTFGYKSLKDDIKSYIQNPNQFNINGNKDLDMDNKYINLWHMEYKGSHTWERKKTVYDPSPIGFSVPPVGVFNGFTIDGQWTDNLEKINSDGSFNNGYNFYTQGWKTGSVIKFPACGSRTANGVYSPAEAGWCWMSFTTTGATKSAYMLAFFKSSTKDNTVGPLLTSYKGTGNAVISCKED